MAKINTVFNLTDNVSNRLRTINNTVNSSVMGFESMAGKLITVNSALDLLGKGLNLIKSASSFLGKFISDASEYESLLVRLAVSIGDFSEAEKEFEKLQQFAADSPFDLPGVVRASIMFRNVGVEAEKLIPTIKMLGDVAQGSDEYFNRIAMNYMQIKSIGKASAMDLKQFAMMEIPIYDVLAQMGVTGTATANDIDRAFQIMTSAGGKFYNSMTSNAGTMSGRITNLQDAMQQFSAKIGNKILPTMKSMTQSLGRFVEEVGKLNSFNLMLNKMQNYANQFKEEITSLVATVLYLGSIVTLIASAMAVAWAVANWPITVAIILITSFIRVIFNLISDVNDASVAMNGFGNQCAYAGQMFGQAVGLIVGFVSGLFNVVYNVFAYLFNIFKTISELIVNMFKNPIKAIQGFFINCATVVIDTLTLVAGAIDWLFGGTLNRALNEASKKLQKFKKDNVATDGYITGGIGQAGLLELKDINGVPNFIKDFGTFGNEVGLAFEKAFKFKDLIQDENEEDKNKYDSNGALIVSDKNTVDLADDFRELLSKHATQKFNLNFSKVTPNVNIGGITVNNNADVDAIYDTIVSGAEDAQSSSLGG